MNLSFQSAYAGLIQTHDNKQIFGIKTQRLISRNNFNMSQTLPVGADFILALDNENAFGLQNAVRAYPKSVSLPIMEA